MAAITGFDSCRRVGPERARRAQPGQVLQVGAGAERGLVAGEDRHLARRRRPRRRGTRRAAAAAVSLLMALRTLGLVDAHDAGPPAPSGRSSDRR